jgi:hypothetical protein
LLDRLRLGVTDEAIAKLEHGPLIVGQLDKRLVESLSVEVQLDFLLRAR